MADEPSGAANENGADVAVEIAGQKVNLRNVKSLNTLATIATLIIVFLIGYIIFTHTLDAKESGKEIAAELKATNKDTAIVLRETSKEISTGLKELAIAARESNCLLAMEQGKRAEAADLCKRISR